MRYIFLKFGIKDFQEIDKKHDVALGGCKLEGFTVVIRWYDECNNLVHSKLRRNLFYLPAIPTICKTVVTQLKQWSSGFIFARGASTQWTRSTFSKQSFAAAIISPTQLKHLKTSR